MGGDVEILEKLHLSFSILDPVAALNLYARLDDVARDLAESIPQGTIPHRYRTIG